MSVSRQTRQNFACVAMLVIVGLIAYLFPPHQARNTLALVAGIAILVGCFLYACVTSHKPDSAWCDSSAVADFPGPPEGAQPNPYTGEVKKKHPQHILAMHAALFDGSHHFSQDVNHLRMETFLSWPETQSALVAGEREALEHDDAYRQLLPYVLVRQMDEHGDTRYLAYQRTILVGEQRLAGKTSVGFGGHVDLTGVAYEFATSVIDLRTTLLMGAIRECEEELRSVAYPFPGFHQSAPNFADLFITMQSDPERNHVGVVMVMDIAAGIVLECAEEELHTLGMKTREELLAAHASGEITLEAWSRVLLQSGAV